MLKMYEDNYLASLLSEYWNTTTTALHDNESTKRLTASVFLLEQQKKTSNRNGAESGTEGSF